MGVMIDDSSLDSQSLGLHTVGDVLSYVSREERLVIHLTIDGQSPDLDQLESIRKTLVRDHVIFMETVHQSQIAREVLDEVDQQLRQAELFCDDAVALLRKGSYNEALKRLAGCFEGWSFARESLEKVARLHKLDLNTVQFDGTPLSAAVREFAQRLSQVREALESRDHVELADVLSYDMKPAARRWSGAISSLRQAI